jgi:hypothetical protein
MPNRGANLSNRERSLSSMHPTLVVVDMVGTSSFQSGFDFEAMANPGSHHLQNAHSETFKPYS